MSTYEPLVKAFGDGHYAVRVSAALTLGDLGDERAVEPLLAVLNNDDTDSVRTGAIVSLGVLGDQRAMEPLEKLLKAEKKETSGNRLNMRYSVCVPYYPASND